MKYLKRLVAVGAVLLLLLGSTAIPAAAHGPVKHYPGFRPYQYRYPPRPYPFYRPFGFYRPVPGFSAQISSIYVVKPNDTLFRIARRFGTSVGAILAANPQIRNPNRIFIGQRLIMPGGYAAPGSGAYGGGGAYGGDQAYGGAEQPQKTEPRMTQPQGQAQVIMQNVSFQPGQITVKVGAPVTWTNRDGFAHTVTAGTRSNPTGLFDSGNVGAGGTFSYTFQQPGTYNYFCRIHNGMSGVVIVEQ